MFLWTVGLLASSQRKHGGDARVRRRKSTATQEKQRKNLRRGTKYHENARKRSATQEKQQKNLRRGRYGWLKIWR